MTNCGFYHRRSARRWRVGAWVAIVLTCGASGGCATPGQRVFDGTAIGAQWNEIPNHGIYTELGQFWWRYTLENRAVLSVLPSPYWYFEDLPIGGDVICYGVVVGEGGDVVAKITDRWKDDQRRYLAITSQGLAELLDVEGHYPFETKVVALPDTELQVRVSEYPPLVRPGSAADPVLPSGVRASLWAVVATSLRGWPSCARGDGEVIVTIDGRQVDWHSVVEKVSGGTLTGTIEISER